MKIYQCFQLCSYSTPPCFKLILSAFLYHWLKDIPFKIKVHKWKQPILCSHSTASSCFGEVTFAFMNFFEGLIENEPAELVETVGDKLWFHFQHDELLLWHLSSGQQQQQQEKKVILCFDSNWFHICTICFNLSVADSRSCKLEADFELGAHLVVVLESTWWKHFWNTWTAFCFFRPMTLTLLHKQRHSKTHFHGEVYTPTFVWTFQVTTQIQWQFFIIQEFLLAS